MTDLAAFAIPIAFIFGLLAGRSLEAVRWRANADQIQRIESGGRLFKVHIQRHDERCIAVLCGYGAGAGGWQPND